MAVNSTIRPSTLCTVVAVLAAIPVILLAATTSTFLQRTRERLLRHNHYYEPPSPGAMAFEGFQSTGAAAPTQSCTVTLFFAEWCPHCHRFLPEWRKLGERVKSEGLPIKLVEHVAGSPGTERAEARYAVNGYPTIVIEKSTGGGGAHYTGERTAAAIISVCMQ